MSYSSTEHTANGSTVNWSIPFDYLDRDHLIVRVDKVPTTQDGALYKFSWINDTTLRVDAVADDSAVPSPLVIEIIRSTPIDTPAVVFGSGSALTAGNLNKSAEYLTFALQEATDDNEKFTKLYLGSFSAAPATDNEGDTLLVGAVYYDTIEEALFYWTGSTWIIGESTVAAYVAASDAETAQAAAEAAESDAVAAKVAAEAVETNVTSMYSSLLNVTPVGAIVWYPFEVPPSTWITLDGSDVDYTYPELRALFIAQGSIYGVNGGTGHPRLPDMRGMFVRAADNGRGIDTGRLFGSQQSHAIENIVGKLAFKANSWVDNLLFKKVDLNYYDDTPTEPDSSNAAQIEFDASNVVNTADETRPINVAMLPIIKASSS